VDDSGKLRELLVADLALSLGVAEARDVAAALQRYWDRQGVDGVRFSGELARIADLDEDAVTRLERGVDDLLEQAGGDPRQALLTRGGLDGSIHLALGGEGAELSRALTRVGAGARVPLRRVPEGRYRDFSPIGQGGMGIVYLALDTELNRKVALKIVRPNLGPDAGDASSSDPLALTPPEAETDASEQFAELSARFLQEAWVTGGLEHPSIVPVYELGRTPEGVPYYTMRYVRGARTLEETMEEAKSLEARFALLEPFLKVCDAIRYAHARGVIHRDLKPRNIVIGEYGEVVVLDWGLAKTTDRPDLTVSSWKQRIDEYREAGDLHTVASALGTPGYMSPEAALGRVAEVDERSDVYSLGAMLFQILTRRLPYAFQSYLELLAKLEREPPARASEVDDDVPAELSDICAGALAPRKEDRTTDVGSLAAAIRSWQEESSIRREIRGLMREAEAAFEGTEGLVGEALLRQLDRVAAVCSRVLRLRKRHGRAKRLLQSSERMRARAMQQRELAIQADARAARGRLLRRTVAAALVLLAAFALVAAWLIEGKREAAETQRSRAEEAEKRTAQALTTVEKERDAKSALFEQMKAQRDEKDRLLKQVEAEQRRTAEALGNLRAEEAARKKVEAERDVKARAAAAARAKADAEQEAKEQAEAREEAARRERALAMRKAKEGLDEVSRLEQEMQKVLKHSPELRAFDAWLTLVPMIESQDARLPKAADAFVGAHRDSICFRYLRDALFEGVAKAADRHPYTPARHYSVPVEVDGETGVRILYRFDDQAELEDFEVKGTWEVKDGQLRERDGALFLDRFDLEEADIRVVIPEPVVVAVDFWELWSSDTKKTTVIGFVTRPEGKHLAVAAKSAGNVIAEAVVRTGPPWELVYQKRGSSFRILSGDRTLAQGSFGRWAEAPHCRIGIGGNVVLDELEITTNVDRAWHRSGGFHHQGRIKNWHLVGPFACPDFDVRKGLEEKTWPEIRPFDPRDRGGESAWRFHRFEDGGVGLGKTYGRKQDVFAYAAIRAWCPERRNAVLEIEADDVARVWVNDSVVLRASQIGETHRVNVRLNRGTNLILVKVVNREEAWWFGARFLSRSGEIIRDLSYW
jgi:serine/threonine protein kinase